MTTIDHASEAREALSAAYHVALPYESAETQYLGALLDAQVHATLALVEQQRIANIIALGETLDYRNTYMGEAQMRPDIKKGLGL